MKFHVMSCRECGRDEFLVGYISRARLCEDCGIRAAITAALEMHHKQGKAWDKYLDKMSEFIDTARPPGGSG